MVPSGNFVLREQIASSEEKEKNALLYRVRSLLFSYMLAFLQRTTLNLRPKKFQTGRLLSSNVPFTLILIFGQTLQELLIAITFLSIFNGKLVWGGFGRMFWVILEEKNEEKGKMQKERESSQYSEIF